MGKTSTKEMVAAVLSEKYNVLKTEGNFNNEVGVPLTIFRLRDEHEIAVIEMGISEFGEMSRLAEIVRPDSVVMTNIGPCHLEQLHDLDGVFQAKTEVFQYLTGKGVVCLNGDDGKLRQVKEVCGKAPVFFGRDAQEGLTVYADHIENRQLQGVDALFHIIREDVCFNANERAQGDSLPDVSDSTLNESFNVHIPLPGEHTVNNALAGAAIGHFYGLTAEEIQRGIANIKGLRGRMNPIRTESCLVIDDCYNANPQSMMNALSLLAQTKRAQKAEIRTVAILGDMFELGENSEELHREVGRFAAKEGIDAILIAGENAKAMYEAAREAYADKPGKNLEKINHDAETAADDPAHSVLRYFENTEKLLASLKKEELIQKGDVVLIKASHAMGFERIVAFITDLSSK